MTRIGHLAGYVVLIVLLTAGAAQGLSGSNTVFSDDIVDGQVTGADIQNLTIRGADVAPGSIGLSRLGGQWTSPVKEVLYGDVTGYAYAPCPPGQTAISGSVISPSAASALMASQPVADGWIATYRNWHSAATYIEVSALCVKK